MCKVGTSVIISTDKYNMFFLLLKLTSLLEAAICFLTSVGGLVVDGTVQLRSAPVPPCNLFLYLILGWLSEFSIASSNFLFAIYEQALHHAAAATSRLRRAAWCDG